MWFRSSRDSVRRLLFCTVVVLGIASGCSTPSSPTPPPPPPPPEAPTITCSENISRGTVSAGGMEITYPAPETRGGQTPLNTTCSHESGATFPIGPTTVDCSVTDGLNRQASCSFTVTITKLPQLSRLKYMAFGDSITSAEVTFPGSTASVPTSGKADIVLSAAHPAVLLTWAPGR